jgi:multimeric flavodoxin WrbA
MKKQIMVLLGSPRKKGNSAKLAEQVVKGAKEQGAKVETFYLNGLNIKPCQACGKCTKTKAGCAVQDDMQTLYPKIQEAHTIVIASPIYWFNISAQTKTFIDRLYSIGLPERNLLKGKQFVFLLVYADEDPFSSGAVNALRSFQDMCRYLEAPIVDMLYGSAGEAGEITSNSDLMKRAYELGRRLADL